VTNAHVMPGEQNISNYLADVLGDWRASQGDFPRNVYLTHYWPIPFFGNPATALVATIGVNPSSGEFAPNRNWSGVKNIKAWKLRLKNYFNCETLPHNWFGPWRAGLKLLDVSYKAGTAAHFDVSYRSTTAMFDNNETDQDEFRRMVEHDIVWFFRLLPLCPKLRGLLTFGPIIRSNGQPESLVGFVRKSAPHHGFKVLPDGGLCHESKQQPPRKLFLHDATARGLGTVTERVVANLTQHRDELCRKIHLPD
jgi:hypothetical protein